ncbi:MAG: hypothetical protein K2M95_06065 [Clostridiales bacterium]|nr:hypothetical protein [Clostridiales bacterium]
MKLAKYKIVMIVAASFGTLAILMLLAPGVSIRALDKWEGVMGFKMAFGIEKDAKFNFGFFLPFLLALIGIVLTVVSFFINNKIVKIIAGSVFALAALFFFLYLPLYPTLAASQMTKEAIKGMMKAKYIKLGGGAVAAAIFSLLASGATFFGTFVLKD